MKTGQRAVVLKATRAFPAGAIIRITSLDHLSCNCERRRCAHCEVALSTERFVNGLTLRRDNLFLLTKTASLADAYEAVARKCQDEASLFTQKAFDERVKAKLKTKKQARNWCSKQL